MNRFVIKILFYFLLWACVMTIVIFAIKSIAHTRYQNECIIDSSQSAVSYGSNFVGRPLYRLTYPGHIRFSGDPCTKIVGVDKETYIRERDRILQKGK